MGIALGSLIDTVTHTGAAGNEDLLIRPSAQEVWEIISIQAKITEALTMAHFLYDGTGTCELCKNEALDANETWLWPNGVAGEANENSYSKPLYLDYNHYLILRALSMADSKVFDMICFYRIHNNY